MTEKERFDRKVDLILSIVPDFRLHCDDHRSKHDTCEIWHGQWDMNGCENCPYGYAYGSGWDKYEESVEKAFLELISAGAVFEDTMGL